MMGVLNVDDVMVEEVMVFLEECVCFFEEDVFIIVSEVVKIILDGVKVERWCIFVGDDVYLFDKMVCEVLEDVYE